MSISLPRLDLTTIFCDVDDFYTAFEVACNQLPQLPYDGEAKPYRSRLSVSEVMTIVIAFHGSGFRTFKDFYTCQVLPHWRQAFTHLVSYNRFVELVPWSVMALIYFLQTTFDDLTGISFIDSTSVVVCHPNRAKQNKVFKHQADWGKSSVKWYFGYPAGRLRLQTTPDYQRQGGTLSGHLNPRQYRSRSVGEALRPKTRTRDGQASHRQTLRR
jgi:hypothetical protein